MRGMNMTKNIIPEPGIRRLVICLAISFTLVLTSCTTSQSSKSARHRSPASTGKRKCGCSMLSPVPTPIRTIMFYHVNDYALQA